MNTPEPKHGRTESLWPPILFVGAVVLDLYLASQVEAAFPGGGKWVIGLPVAIGAVAIFLNVIWGRTASETGKNFAQAVKAILGTLVALLAIGSIGMCMGGGNHSGDSSNEGQGGVPDSYRRP